MAFEAFLGVVFSHQPIESDARRYKKPVAARVQVEEDPATLAPIRFEEGENGFVLAAGSAENTPGFPPELRKAFDDVYKQKSVPALPKNNSHSALTKWLELSIQDDIEIRDSLRRLKRELEKNHFGTYSYLDETIEEYNDAIGFVMARLMENGKPTDGFIGAVHKTGGFDEYYESSVAHQAEIVEEMQGVEAEINRILKEEVTYASSLR